MNVTALVTVVVALIAAASAYASQRAASKAATRNTDTSSRVDMEKEAYERARTYDTETIRRQDAEIDELRAENRALREEMLALKLRVRHLEEHVPSDKLYPPNPDQN